MAWNKGPIRMIALTSCEPCSSERFGEMRTKMVSKSNENESKRDKTNWYQLEKESDWIDWKKVQKLMSKKASKDLWSGQPFGDNHQETGAKRQARKDSHTFSFSLGLQFFIHKPFLCPLILWWVEYLNWQKFYKHPIHRSWLRKSIDYILEPLFFLSFLLQEDMQGWMKEGSRNQEARKGRKQKSASMTRISDSESSPVEILTIPSMNHFYLD